MHIIYIFILYSIILYFIILYYITLHKLYYYRGERVREGREERQSNPKKIIKLKFLYI